jgi:hypothetical protein
MPDYLNFAIRAIELCDFVSSTQAEFDENDELIRVNDFSTPSGWFMPLTTLKKVGEFNENYKFHLDNEWLGRLFELKLKRIHLVESTAPVLKKNAQQVRPWLLNVLNFSGGFCSLERHESPYPLVRRFVHSYSGMAQIATKTEYSEISRKEYENLINRFGAIPW